MINYKRGALALASLVGVTALSAQQKQPNIIVFLVDDLGWNDTSVPISGEKTLYNQRYVTPNIERMAEEGILMTNAHAQALSVPSRASLMSGQNSIRNGVSGDFVPTTNVQNTLEIEPGHPLDHRIALPRQLKMAGYKTIHCGKYHLCEYESDAPSPSDVGFDVNIAGSEYGAPGSYQPEQNYTSQAMLDEQQRNVMVGLEEYFGSEKHLTEALTEAALKQIDMAVEEEKPFFLYLAHFAVHTPVQPHKSFMELYDEGDTKHTMQEAQYGSMITGVDASLGDVMTKLEELNIDDNTVIIFFGDNGGRVLFRNKESLYGDYQHNYPLRSGKASIYEGGTRVPAIAYAPGRFKAGVVSDAPVMIEDIYTTAISLANGEVPQHHIVDGKDLTPLFESGKTPSNIAKRDMYFYLPYRFEGEQFNGSDFADGGVSPSSSIIRGDWKLIYFHKDMRFELYNLANDLGETKNLINSNRKKARELVVDMDAFLRGNSALNSIRLPERLPVLRPLEAYNQRY